MSILVGQLGQITNQTRPDMIFEVCQLASTLNNNKVDDILHAQRLLLKSENENILLRCGLPSPIENFKIVTMIHH